MTLPTVTIEIEAAEVDGVKGWAVTWGPPRRKFRQCLFFDTRPGADHFAEGIRAGSSVRAILFGRTLSDRGRKAAEARMRSLTPERRAEIGRKAVKTRWRRVRAAERAAKAAAKAAEAAETGGTDGTGSGD